MRLLAAASVFLRSPPPCGIGSVSFNRHKQWRDLATRYAKRATIYRASLVIASIVIWLS
jgi:hypothetical protein